MDLNITILYILICLVILIVIYKYIFFSNKKEEENFKIIQYMPEEINYIDLFTILNSRFGNVEIYNLNNLKFSKHENNDVVLKNQQVHKISETKHMEEEYENKEIKKFVKFYNRKKNHYLLFGNHKHTIPSLPFITNDKQEFIGGYNTCISPFGDLVLIYKYAKGVENQKITWNNLNNNYIKERNNSNTFLYEKGVKEEDLTKHNSYLVLTRYLYNNNPALHVNYICRRQGVEKDLLFQTFIGFLNYINDFINKNKIYYFSIAGRTGINSLKWQTAIKNVFKDSVYFSPGVEKKFLSDSLNDFYYTPDFICVNKNLAPHGVYFYLSEPFGNYTTNKILVCEILKKKNKKFKKSKNDNTQLIYDDAVYLKEQFKKNLKIDNLQISEINFKNIDLKKVNEYVPIEKHVKTLHFFNT